MPYLQVADFKYGLDRRRARVAGIPGTLWNIKNAHLSRGGDIERCKKFVPKYALPAGTFGAAHVRGQLYVFGSADLAASVPVGVKYQRLQVPGANMTRFLWSAAFDGKLYVIADFDDGNLHHFYDGTRVTDWATVADTIAEQETLANYLTAKINESGPAYAVASGSTIQVTARVAGTGYTISASATNGGADNTQSVAVANLQPNVAEVEEVRATGSLTVTSGSEGSGNEISAVYVNGVNLLGGHTVPFYVDVEQTAFRVAVAINNESSVHGYSAAQDGASVEITAPPGVGASVNGHVMVVNASGNVVVVCTTYIGGGVTRIEPVAQVDEITIGGTFEAADTYIVTIDGTQYKATGRASGTGTSIFVYKHRLWSTVGSIFHYSKLNDGSNWTDATVNTGAGFINISNESEGTQNLVCATSYGEYAAVFSDKNIRLYSLSTTPSENAFQQQIDNTGAIAPRSVLPYGAYEVFYLDNTGVRSLQARYGYNILSVNDIGTAVDVYVQDLLRSLTPRQIADAVAVVEPIDGRYWLSIGSQVLVLSYFPSSKITAWSVYDVGLSFTDFVRIGRKLYARAGDTLYLYGGESGNEYPEDGEQIVSLETPFLDAQDPATKKNVNGFDMACSNTWAVTMLPDPNDESKAIDIGAFDGTTYHGSDICMPSIGGQTHFAFTMVCSRGGPATISSAVVHFNKIGAA